MFLKRHGCSKNARSGIVDSDPGQGLVKQQLIKGLRRLCTYTVLLDCALLFFAGLPLRIALHEIRSDLPCEEMVFDAEHPFTHPDFAFSRSTSAQEAFQSLFLASVKGVRISQELTLLDTFVLIHSTFPPLPEDRIRSLVFMELR